MARLAAALDRVRIAGPKTNLAFLSAIVASPEFRAGGVDTGFIDRAMPTLRGEALSPALAAAAMAECAEREAAEAADGARGPWARRDAFELGGVAPASMLAVEIDGEPVTAASPGRRTARPSSRSAARSRNMRRKWRSSGSDREALVLEGGGSSASPFPIRLRATSTRRRGAAKSRADLRPRHRGGRGGRCAVAKGDPLFSVEAMKMEHGVAAPLAGASWRSASRRASRSRRAPSRW